MTAKPHADVYGAYLDLQNLVSGGSVAPNWTADGAGLWYVEGAPEDTSIMRVDITSGETAPLFDVAGVRSALTDATGHEPPYRGLPFDSFTPAPDGRVTFAYDGAQWLLDPATSIVERMPDLGLFKGRGPMSEAERTTPGMWKRGDYLIHKNDVPEQLSPSGEWFAGVRDDNIVLRSTRDGRQQQITRDGDSDCFWDLEAMRVKLLPGMQIAFGAVSPWSPDSLTLLAYRRDITGVFRNPRVNWLKPFEEVEYIPYQKAGARLDRVQPVFVDIRSGRRTPVALGDVEDRYVQLLGWHPGGEALIIIYSRDFKRLDIVAASRDTGTTRALLSESASTFVKIQHEAMYFGEHGFRLLPDGSGFLWLSTRDGWNHIYRYDMDGNLKGQLTTGDWPVYAVCHVGDGFVYFTAAVDAARPYDVHVCRVPLEGGGMEQLTREKGIHTPTFAPAGQAFIDVHSAVDRPVRSDLLKSDGSPLRNLSEMDISRLEAVGYTPAEEFTVKAADGVTDLWGVMYKPHDFDPQKKYPVVEYLYAGPQIICAQRFFAVGPTRFSNLSRALAQLGYIVVCLDARGTPGRSKAFQDVVYGAWAVNEIPDHAAAIRQLCERNSWMDAGRVGITGHSWGGYFSTCALMQAPDVYHAAVSSAPGYDPWDANIYEPYLDLPHKNRAAYEHADLIRQAGKIKGKLMIVAGTSDHGVITSTMKMTRALLESGIDHEYVVVPQAGHGYLDKEEDYFLMKLTGWFDRHVKNRTIGK